MHRASDLRGGGWESSQVWGSPRCARQPALVLCRCSENPKRTRHLPGVRGTKAHREHLCPLAGPQNLRSSDSQGFPETHDLHSLSPDLPRVFSPPAPRFQPAELGCFSSSPSCCQILPLGTPAPRPAGPAPRPGAHTCLVRACSPPARAACSGDTRSRAALTRPLGVLLSDLIPALLPSSSLGEQGYP